MLRESKRNVQPYLFISPALLFFALFMAYPILNVFFYSLQNYSIMKPYLDGFIGFGNFIKLFTDDKIFWKSITVSLKWVCIQVPLQLVFGMIAAMILNKKFPGRGIIRAVFFAPWAVSGVLTALLWSLIYNENMGVLNDLLLKMHVITKRVAWVSAYSTTFGALSVAELWRGLPFFSIMLLAGLQSIPEEVYEACAVDGTTKWQTFWYITLPQLKNTVILSTLLRIVWEFNNVDVIYNLTGGGPVNSTTTLTMYLTQTAVRDSNFGYGSAIAVFSFILLSAAASVYIYITGFDKQGD